MGLSTTLAKVLPKNLRPLATNSPCQKKNTTATTIAQCTQHANENGDVDGESRLVVVGDKGEEGEPGNIDRGRRREGNAGGGRGRREDDEQ